MSEDIKLEVIRNTQDSLSKYIKKPPLTEKLLRKPPFRYLHDITTAVMRETGYLQGLYSQDELNPENIKDREAKIAFLEKLIAAVNLSTGVTISARPSKIVAGLDVAKTNELLQTIAKALEKNVDSSQAVEQILNNRKGSNQQTSTKKENSKTKNGKVIKEGKPAETKIKESRDVLKKKPKDVKSKNVNKIESRKEKRPSKEELTTKNDKGPVIEETVAVENKNNSEPQQDNILQTEVEGVQPSNITPSQQIPPTSPSPHPQKPPASPNHGNEQSKARSKPLDNPDTPQAQTDTKSNLKNEEVKPLEEELKRPQSARAVHRKKAGTRKPISEAESNERDDAALPKAPAPDIKDPSPLEKSPNQFAPSEVRDTKRPRTAARPASARPGAPRVRDRGTVLLSQKDHKIVNEPVNVIVDSKELPKDDDETVVKVEASTSLTDAVVEQEMPADFTEKVSQLTHLQTQEKMHNTIFTSLPIPNLSFTLIPGLVPSNPISNLYTSDILIYLQVVDDTHLLTGDQGHLVSQILETQKELEDPSTSLETTSKFDIRRDRAVVRENVYKEVEKLQAAIQALTQAANPLGKLIDFLQEDVDSMQMELESWITMNRDLAQQLNAEERLTEQSIEPLARQLEDINMLIEEQLEETSTVKAAVIRNDERLTRLLQSGSSHRAS